MDWQNDVEIKEVFIEFTIYIRGTLSGANRRMDWNLGECKPKSLRGAISRKSWRSRLESKRKWTVKMKGKLKIRDQKRKGLHNVMFRSTVLFTVMRTDTRQNKGAIGSSSPIRLFHLVILPMFLWTATNEQLFKQLSNDAPLLHSPRTLAWEAE
jgi:hypothetical protein